MRLGEYNVLTEEDCVIDGEFEDCSDPSVDIEPEEIIVNPYYDPESIHQHNDIALIRLKEKVNFTGNFACFFSRANKRAMFAKCEILNS